jgi:hypothetical protein
MTTKYTMLMQQASTPFVAPPGTGVPSAQAVTRVAGWSESWYSSAGVAAGRPIFLALCQLRAACLGANAAIIGQRYQLLGGASSTGHNIFPGLSSNIQDMAGVSLLCSIGTATTGNIRRFALKGIPDAMVYAGEFAPTSAFLNAVNLYARELGQGNWAGKFRDLTVAPWVVTGVVNGVVTMAAPTGVVIGSRVQFVRTKDQYGQKVTNPPGGYIVTGWTDSAHFTVGSFPPRYGPVIGGFLRLFGTPNYYPVDASTFAISRTVLRKVGRPFFGFRGRASKRT